MTGWTRRDVGRGAAALGLTVLPRTARAGNKPRVLVVGGGIGGATVARYLAISGQPLDITLIEPQARYTTCCFSNLYLAGARSFESLTHGYEALAARYGIAVLRDTAVAMDPVGKRVRLASGRTLAYDRLVVSPGIAFRDGAIEGYDEAARALMPHAWIAGPQTELLRGQLEAMKDGGVFLIVAPPNPYRCPAAPYERASLAAYYLKQFKPRSKVLILDAKETFKLRDLFENGWARHYPGMIEWLPLGATGGLKSVDAKARTITTKTSTFTWDVANVIPPQRAGDIVRVSGLTDATGWCPVDPATFGSTLADGVHVIGDAADVGSMPKSAFCANSQAKACALAIVADLTGAERGAPRLLGASFALIAGDDAVSEAMSFEVAQGKVVAGKSFASRVDDDRETRRRTVRDAYGWYDAFTHDVFG